MKKVLVIEDNSVNRELIEEVLATQEVTVMTAVDGRSGLESAVQNNPDLILLDIQLPEMDGFEVLANLRRLPAFVQTPVIALTAFAMQSDREKVLTAGFNGHITKPLELAIFRREIQNYLADPA